MVAGKAAGGGDDLVMDAAHRLDEAVEPTYRFAISFSHAESLLMIFFAVDSIRWTSSFAGFLTFTFGSCFATIAALLPEA